MGVVNFGIPEQEMRWLKKRMKLTTAVEGGSYTGGTALNMSKEFVTVLTIEKSDAMFRKAKKILATFRI
jgi:predicted O-methyltransferase YrrM